jgi:TPR repeat protein
MLAADQGNADAQYELGVLYERGSRWPSRWPVDKKEAARLFRLAADQGHTGAPGAFRRTPRHG